ncbi:mechanosensitive ion channel family protein [Sediminitomix flava]|uniref:Small conductance mechanosensitive channel n=1 Tax=Sediminitomix flava TaxID=379075 RepID=A0A315ZHG6_SEDFL|nr:mechanosensitive ion channel family protein [Sediminitomix flava]PWJ44154.1 small conductance mechanosensitive channel [Sediminitomix flava]
MSSTFSDVKTMEEHFINTWDKLVDKLMGWIEASILILPNILIGLVTILLFYWLSKYLQILLNRILKNIIHHSSIRNLFTNILSIGVFVIGCLLTLSILNLDGTIKSLLAGAGVAGLAISLALQGTLSNTFSGIFISIKNEIQEGDWIESNGYLGRVVEINLRNTKLKEADNNIVILPNTMILNNPLKNYGLTHRYRATISCGVGYESDLERVRELTILAIESIFPSQGIDEEIEFYYKEFGDSSINFIVRFWVDAKESKQAMQVESDAIMKIKSIFDENSINIPFPIRTLIYQQDRPI